MWLLWVHFRVVFTPWGATYHPRSHLSWEGVSSAVIPASSNRTESQGSKWWWRSTWPTTQLWLGRGSSPAGTAEQGGEDAGAGTWLPTAMPGTSEEGEGHFSQESDSSMKEVACSQRGSGWAGVLLPQGPLSISTGIGEEEEDRLSPAHSQVLVNPPKKLPLHAAGKQSGKLGRPHPPMPTPMLGPHPTPSTSADSPELFSDGRFEGITPPKVQFSWD